LQDAHFLELLPEQPSLEELQALSPETLVSLASICSEVMRLAHVADDGDGRSQLQIELILRSLNPSSVRLLAKALL